MSVSLVLIPVVIAGAGILFTRIEALENNVLLYKTKMRNARILQESVINLDYTYKTLNKNQIEVQHQDGHIIFEKNEDNTLQATFSKEISQEQAEACIAEIYDEYTTLVQQQTYEKLVENIKNYNLNLESEEITEDNSIILTLTVQE